MSTAFKTKRWFADTYQKWMDIEAKLIGNGKISKIVPTAPTLKIKRIKPPLETRIISWKPHQVLLDDTAWEEWTYEWEGDKRPAPNDRNIWDHTVARMLALTLPVSVNSGDILHIKNPYRDTQQRGHVLVVDVVLDQGPEMFVLSTGYSFNLSQMARISMSDYRIGFKITPKTEEFFARCRRQYFPTLGNMSSFDHFNWRKLITISMQSPNCTSQQWKEVLEARKQRAFSAFLGRKLV